MQATRPVKDPRKQRKLLYNAPAHLRHKLMAAPLSPQLLASKGAKTLPVRKGDTVRIMRGDHKGFEGKISRVDLKNYRIYVEGLTREKVDGTAIFVPVHPSKVMIRNLNLDDKWRKGIVERKKELPKKEEKVEKAVEKPPKKAEKAEKVTRKPPAKAAEVKEAKEVKEVVEEKPVEVKEKVAEAKVAIEEKPKETKLKAKPTKAPTKAQKKPKARKKRVRKKPAAKKKKEEKPTEEEKPAEKEEKPKAAKRTRAKRKTASKTEGGT
jgi:large subunit ribosomal protein L24